MTTRCICCDLPEGSCGKAIEQREANEEKDRLRRLRARGWFTATYAGVCVGCKSSIVAGKTLVKRSPLGGGWYGDCCAHDSERASTP